MASQTVSMIIQHAASHRHYLEANMDQPETFPVSGGQIVAFSQACPGKNEPNDDSAGVFHTDCGATVLAVADGVGGGPLGYKASAIAMQCLSESLLRQRTSADLRPAILDGIEKANEEILDMGTGAATTLSVVEIQNRVARGYQVGDSVAIVLGSRGAIRWKSTSHSPVGYAIESGMLDEADAMYHDERHLVSNLVGARTMHIEIGPAVRLSPRDSIVVASDGLFDNLQLSEVVQLARAGRPLDRMNALMGLVSARMRQAGTDHPGKPDDVAIVLMTP